jgi:hypothetical protein
MPKSLFILFQMPRENTGKTPTSEVEIAGLRWRFAVVFVATALAGCGGATSGDREGTGEAAQRRHAVAVRTKPLWLDAFFESEGGRTSVSWIGPIYPPAPLSYPGSEGSGVASYRYRYRLGKGTWSVWQTTKKPGFVLLHTHKGEKLDLFVRPTDDAGKLREPASALLTIAGPTLTAANPGGEEPGEYGKAELKPEP